MYKGVVGYYCNWDIRWSYYESDNYINISSVVISSVSIFPAEFTGVAGVSNLSLRCNVTLSGLGTPTITWTNPLSNQPSIHQNNSTSYTSLLHIGRVRESDTGVYTCKASIQPSKKNSSVKVNISSKSKYYILYHW